MIRAGESIENPVTGERLVFTATSAETGGEYVRFECFVEPSGSVAAAHIHPFQEELFEIIEGSVTFKISGRELPTRPGDRILVPAGTKHQFWNAGEEAARFALPGVRHYQARSVRIEAPTGIEMTLDGEIAARTPAEVCLARDRVRIMIPGEGKVRG